jgi:hypothetical protein
LFEERGLRSQRYQLRMTAAAIVKGKVVILMIAMARTPLGHLAC